MKEEILRIFLKNQLCSFGEIPHNTISLQYHVMFPAAETLGFLAELQQEIGLVPLLESNPYLTSVTNKQIVLV